MKKHAYLSLVGFFVLFVLPSVIHGAGLTRPIGGRVLNGPASLSAAIVCAATYGPFIMTPFNIATPGPYFIRTATNGVPRVGGYMLGLYKIVPDMTTCSNPETGVPVPAFSVWPYGVSR